MLTLESDDKTAILSLSASTSLDDVQEALKSIADARGVNWRSWLHWTVGFPHDEPLIAWTTERFSSGAYEALVEFAFRRFLPTMASFSEIRQLFQAFSESIQILNSCEAAKKKHADERAERIVASVVSAAGPAAMAACSFAAAGSSDNLLVAGWERAKKLAVKVDLRDEIKDPGVSGGSPTL